MSIEVWELLIREQVRDTLARYNQSGDSGNVAELAQCFTPEGVLEIKFVKGRREARGRDEIFTMLTMRAEGSNASDGLAHRFVRHNLSTVLVHSVTSGRAESSAYFVVYTADGPDHWGRYRDVLVPFDGKWLLQHRRVTVDAVAPSSYLNPVPR